MQHQPWFRRLSLAAMRHLGIATYIEQCNHWHLLLLLLVVSVADAFITILGVKTFGISEGNPLMAWLMGALGLETTLQLKIGLTALIVLVLGLRHQNATPTEMRHISGALVLLFISLAILPWAIFIAAAAACKLLLLFMTT